MFANLIVSKARRPKFDLSLRILDLNNVPLTSGTCYVKWHIASSTAADHRGRTEKSHIKEHKVAWDYSRQVPVRLTIDKNNNLQESIIHFEVVQDYSAGVRGEKITLGFVELNLAEYVEESELNADGEEGVTRRYLMQESKINSTLKIGICMRQLDGERNFVAPPLKIAAVFGGIAGIMAGEQGEQDEVGHLPSINKPRDHGELQDMYRRALAASWAASPGELPADQCVEDIFNGGDGWKDKKQSKHINSHGIGEDSASDEQRRLQQRHHRSHSGSSTKSQSTITDKKAHRFSHKHSSSRETIGRPAIALEPNDTSSENSSEAGRPGFKQMHEVDEFDMRDDLMAWRLPTVIS